MSEAKATVTIHNEVVHFRPLARLKELGKSLGVEIYLTFQGETHSASSIIAITGWELKRSNTVEVTVRGPGNVSLALGAVVNFMDSGWGE